MEAQRGARPNLTPSLLKKTRRPQPRDRIRYRPPSKYPAGHRKAQSCVTQMHEPHRYPQHPDRPSPQGRIQHHYRQNSSGGQAGQGPTVPLPWHGSNTAWPTRARFSCCFQRGIFDTAMFSLGSSRLLFFIELSVAYRNRRDCRPGRGNKWSESPMAGWWAA